MKNLGRETKRAVCYSRSGLGWIPGETRAESWIGGGGSCQGGCTAGSGLLSTGTGASLPFLSFSLQQTASSLGEIIPHIPGAAAATATALWPDFDQCAPSVTVPVGCPGANP